VARFTETIDRAWSPQAVEAQAGAETRARNAEPGGPGPVWLAVNGLTSAVLALVYTIRDDRD
jgi:hypothetical protein